MIGPIYPSNDISYSNNNHICKTPDQAVIKLTKEDFAEKILFFEDIEAICDYEYIKWFFEQLGNRGWLQILNGVIIVRMKIGEKFDRLSESVKSVVSGILLLL